MANVPISGALAEKYGYLSLSIFSGVTVLVGGAILVAARLVQKAGNVQPCTQTKIRLSGTSTRLSLSLISA